MHQPPSCARVCFFICALISLTSVSAVETATTVAVPSPSSLSGRIINAADLPNIVGSESADEHDDPLNRHITLNINSPAASIHHHGAHTHAHEHHHGETLLVPRSSTSSTTFFPQAFDTSLSDNFTTTSCPKFFKRFLSDTTYTNCHAISMLLRDSAAFFQALNSAASTSHILDLACAADVESCAATMSSLASSLLQSNNCAQDYQAGNPVVTNAYIDMITYEPIYRATCLTSPETTDYCFVDAITNTSSAANYDIYLLPYGSTITSAPFPTCNSCIQASLDIFSNWAPVTGQPLTTSYLPTAKAINSNCGAGFAAVNITVRSDSTTAGVSAAVSLNPLIAIWVTLVASIVLLAF
ncbi:hypothetical protein ARAM_003633 [Aspergillus rambellii]|uniref:DUF7729 domain-containing protein n=1 Tax=Aspergillus rambellii TaxID=308745 RepID=A0A0F8VMF2_9EURO|nr:hypothetical protein ARAM_003633 [Aspergillus rambellii]